MSTYERSFAMPERPGADGRMSPPLEARTIDWFRRDAERNERARIERLQLDGRKSIGQNIEEGAALIALGLEVRRAFERAHR